MEIATGVMTSENSYTYTPDSDLAAADQYRINLVQQTEGQSERILAQSDYFEVKAGES